MAATAELLNVTRVENHIRAGDGQTPQKLNRKLAAFREVERLLESVKKHEDENSTDDAAKIRKLFNEAVQRKQDLTIALKLKRENVKLLASRIGIYTEMADSLIKMLNEYQLNPTSDDKDTARSPPFEQPKSPKIDFVEKSTSLLNIQATFENSLNLLAELKQQVEIRELTLAHLKQVVENAAPLSDDTEQSKTPPSRPDGKLINEFIMGENICLENMIQLMNINPEAYPDPLNHSRAIFGQFLSLIDRWNDSKRLFNQLLEKSNSLSNKYDEIHQTFPGRLEAREKLLRAAQRWHSQLLREQQLRRQPYDGCSPKILNVKHEVPVPSVVFSSLLTNLYHWAFNETQRPKATVVSKPTHSPSGQSFGTQVETVNAHCVQAENNLLEIERQIEQAKHENEDLMEKIVQARLAQTEKDRQQQSPISQCESVPDVTCLENEIRVENELAQRNLAAIERLHKLIENQHAENNNLDEYSDKVVANSQTDKKEMEQKFASLTETLNAAQPKCVMLRILKSIVFDECENLVETRERLGRTGCELKRLNAKINELTRILVQTESALNDLELYSQQIKVQKDDMERDLAACQQQNDKLNLELKVYCGKLKERQERLRDISTSPPRVGTKISAQFNKLNCITPWKDMWTKPIKDRLEIKSHSANVDALGDEKREL